MSKRFYTDLKILQVQLIDELFANEASNKKLAKDTLSLAKDSDVIMTEKKTEGNVMVCDVDAELISMIGMWTTLECYLLGNYDLKVVIS